MTDTPFTLMQYGTHAEPFTFFTRVDTASIRWEGCTVADQNIRPEVMLEITGDTLYARVYHCHHDEPLITVGITRDGHVKEMIVRRSPIIPLTFEDIEPVTGV